MNNDQLNPMVNGIPQDIERYLNEEVCNAIITEIEDYSDTYQNLYINNNEQQILDILIRRRKFDREGPRKFFESKKDFREYVIDVWVNQIGYPSELFPGFAKACKELGIHYYRG